MIPESVAIIPDGNRRLAKRLMKEPWKGHEMGVGKLYDVVEWCMELGITHTTIYALSLENLEKRPKAELEYLFLLARKELDSVLDDTSHMVHRKRARMKFFGRLDLLPSDIQEKIRSVSELTHDYDKHTMNIAMAYGGRQEILDAVKKLSGREVTEDSFRKALFTNGSRDPDLIIRTGGERRLSNFLTFQGVYSELAFLDTFWPELTKEEFTRVIWEFSERERRFGK